MGDFVPGSDFVPGNDIVPGVSDILGIDPSSGIDPGSTYTPTDTTGSPYGNNLPTPNTTGGPTDIGAPSTGIPTETGGGGWTPPTGIDPISKAVQSVATSQGTSAAQKLLNSLTGGNSTGTGTGTGTGTSTGAGTGSGSGTNSFDITSLTPQVTQGSTGPINLVSNIMTPNVIPMSQTTPSFATYAEGGSTNDPLSGLSSISLRHQVSQGHASNPLLLASHNPHFNQLGSTMQFVNPQQFAEGGQAEHVPEFYSEGGMKHTYVQGDGDGTSDSVPAMLANGEFVIPADVVSALGNGSNNSGSKVLDEFLQVIRHHKQVHSPSELPPDSKGPLAYIDIAQHKAEK